MPTAGARPSSSGLFVFAGQEQDIAYDAPDSAGPNALGPPVNWYELEPANGKFNWAPLDTVLERAARAHKKAAVRIYVNADGFFKATPDWFFDVPGAQYYQTDFSASNGIKLPIAWDPVFRREFGQFLTAFGKRYNRNRNIEFIQTNAGGGLYGEMVTAIGCGIGAVSPPCPPGWDEPTALSSIRYWVDRWRAAFPDKNLSLMVNDLGGTLMPDAAAYAVRKKFFLQSNWRILSETTIALYQKYDDRTRIIMEVENGGCVDNTLPGFRDNIIDPIFSYGIAFDYLSFCGVAFSDPPTAAYIHSTVLGKLRKNGPGGV
jgi:hypothetical protein